MPSDKLVEASRLGEEAAMLDKSVKKEPSRDLSTQTGCVEVKAVKTNEIDIVFSEPDDGWASTELYVGIENTSEED